MSHKFKVGDKVRIEWCVGDGEILTNDMHYKLDSDPHCLSTLPIYDVKYGNQIIRILEGGLEKIEEPAPKYKIGDRVIFNYDDLKNIKGKIVHVNNEENRSEHFNSGTFYTISLLESPQDFLVPEKFIINLVPSTEFKEGDEVWVKATIGVWTTTGKIRDCANDIKLDIHGNIFWSKENKLFKSIPPKNEWIALKDGRRPPIAAPLSCYRKSPCTFPRSAICRWDGNEFFILGTNEVFDATHWKPLDEPPSE